MCLQEIGLLPFFRDCDAGRTTAIGLIGKGSVVVCKWNPLPLFAEWQCLLPSNGGKKQFKSSTLISALNGHEML
ncbi:hypothetical protein AAC387_Pa03g0865 [Persea americana]